MKSWPADARDDEIGRLKEEGSGIWIMANELLEAKIDRLGPAALWH